MRRVDRRTPNRLREYRLLKGYEQLEVARLLGLKSHARISRWEEGIAMPSVENLLQLSIIYCTLPDDLYYDLRQEFELKIRRRKWLLEAERDQGG